MVFLQHFHITLLPATYHNNDFSKIALFTSMDQQNLETLEI
jgi:hypothetical protein